MNKQLHFHLLCSCVSHSYVYTFSKVGALTSKFAFSVRSQLLATLWLIVVFDNSLKRQTLNMAKMIIQKPDRAVGILVSVLYLLQIVLTLNLIIISTKCNVIIWMYVVKSLCKVQSSQLPAKDRVMFLFAFL